jgi:hypothetical protein
MADDPAQRDTVPPGERHDEGRGKALRERAVEEARRFLVMFLYIWLWFALFQVYQRMLLRESGIGAASQGFALFNALVLAKVMLVAEDLKIGRWWRARPLIYPILTESLAFAVVFIVFHIVEHVVVGVISGEGVRASVPVIGGGGLAGLFSVAALYFVALIPFFAFRNLGREIGESRLNAMLFGAGAGGVKIDPGP